MEGFAFTIPIEVQFRDVDAMGHVNNAVYASYFETGRVAFYREVFGMRDACGFDFVVARLEIDYRWRVRLGDDCRLGLRVGRVGETSYTFEYQLQVDDRVAAAGRSVQVFFDYARQAKMPVPAGFYEKVAPYLAPR